jgi:hypothetical protein
MALLSSPFVAIEAPVDAARRTRNMNLQIDWPTAERFRDHLEMIIRSRLKSGGSN